jgi:RNA methyltransferase, TrmH family
MLTSTRNPKVQWIRTLQTQAKARREERAFVVEGVRLLEEALEAGCLPQLIFYSEDLNPRGQSLLRAYSAKDVPIQEVSPPVLKAAADTETPQGILAVLPALELPLPPEPDHVLVLDRLRDPGNLGAILRTASAAGVQAVLLAPGTVDPYSPKVIRSAMGAHFRLPVHPLAWAEIKAYLNMVPLNKRPKVYLADAKQGVDYTRADFRSPLALIVGGEAEGVGQEARDLANHRVRIPMPGKAESLNAAVAGAILMFEVVRQRLQ